MNFYLQAAWEVIEEWPESRLIENSELLILANLIAKKIEWFDDSKLSGLIKPSNSLDAIGTDKCKVSVEGGLK